MTKVINCSCLSEQQDALHGKGRRVANSTDKDALRCTVCLKEHLKGDDVVKKVVKK